MTGGGANRTYGSRGLEEAHSVKLAELLRELQIRQAHGEWISLQPKVPLSVEKDESSELS